MLRGAPVAAEAAIDTARAYIADAEHAVALVSSWGSNEELTAFRNLLAGRFTTAVKADRIAQAGEALEDDFLIRADKNPNTRGALALFPDTWEIGAALPSDCDLLLVWGEGFDLSQAPKGARTIVLDAWANPAHARADVFIPLSIQTERAGTYTNFDGRVTAFEACFPKPESVVDAETLFRTLVTPGAAVAATARGPIGSRPIAATAAAGMTSVAAPGVTRK
jgi:NADH-quinone oxidoreductase subunit G